MKRDPLDGLIQIRDRTIGASPSRGGSWTPPIDLHETPEAYVLIAELPGFTKEDFSVRGTPTSVSLTGRRPPMDVRAVQYLRLERGQGDFERTFTFAEPVDLTRISADFSNGLLTVTIPKSGDRDSRRIDIG
jgi:HSP20 family protein